MKDFTDLYGFEFGEQRKQKARPDGPFTFTTPNHSEEDVRFFLDHFHFFMGTIVVEILNPDGTLRFTKTFDRNNPAHLTMFVNKDGVDPKAGRTDHLNPTPKAPRTTWLEPNTTYTCHAYRPTGNNGMPIGLIYSGTDANEVDYGVDTGFRIYDADGNEYELTLKK